MEMARLVEHMAEMTDYSRDLTVNVGSIAGGGPSNRVPHQAECTVNIRAFDESVLQSAIDAIFSLRDGPAAVRAESDGFSCRIGVELLSRNPSCRQNPETDALIEVWMRSAKRIGRSLLVESRGGLSDGNYLSQFLPSLDGLGPLVCAATPRNAAPTARRCRSTRRRARSLRWARSTSQQSES